MTCVQPRLCLTQQPARTSAPVSSMVTTTTTILPRRRVVRHAVVPGPARWPLGGVGQRQGARHAAAGGRLLQRAALPAQPVSAGAALLGWCLLGCAACSSHLPCRLRPQSAQLVWHPTDLLRASFAAVQCISACQYMRQTPKIPVHCGCWCAALPVGGMGSCRARSTTRCTARHGRPRGCSCWRGVGRCSMVSGATTRQCSRRQESWAGQYEG